MSKRTKKQDVEESKEIVFSVEEEKKATEIENTPIEELPYEIIPVQGGGPASIQ